MIRTIIGIHHVPATRTSLHLAGGLTSLGNTFLPLLSGISSTYDVPRPHGFRFFYTMLRLVDYNVNIKVYVPIHFQKYSLVEDSNESTSFQTSAIDTVI